MFPFLAMKKTNISTQLPSTYQDSLTWAKQEIKRLVTQIHTGMSCPSWQWHRTGSSWFPVRTLPVAPLWCDLGFVPNSRGNKAAANLSPILREQRN